MHVHITRQTATRGDPGREDSASDTKEVPDHAVSIILLRFSCQEYWADIGLKMTGGGVHTVVELSKLSDGDQALYGHPKHNASFV